MRAVLGLLSLLLLAATPIDPAGCGGCHREIALQWSQSAHARSGSDPIYLANHAIEPMQWCEGCHAPTKDRTVGCGACHLRQGKILAARPPTPAALDAHPIRFEPTLSQSESCAGCHQFNFPTDRSRGIVTFSEHPMQNTLEEWKKWGGAQTCQACHLPNGNHAIPVRPQISTQVVRLPDGEIEVTLEALGAGHRVPTGDPFHRLRFELCSDESCDRVLASRELGRRVVTATDGWLIGADETLLPDLPTRLQFSAAGVRHWRLLALYAAKSVEPLITLEQRQRELASGPVEPTPEHR